MPSVSSGHIDAALPGLAMGHIAINELEALQVLLPYMVKKQSDDIWDFDTSAAYTVAPPTGKNALEIGPGDEYEQLEYKVSSADAYRCRRYGCRVPILDREAANWDDPALMRAFKTAKVMNTVLSEANRRGLALLGDTSTTFSSYTATPAAQWDADGSDPMDDAITATESMKSNGALVPSMHDVVLLIGEDAWLRCRNNESIIGRGKYSRDMMNCTTDDWVKYLSAAGVSKVIVSRSRYNTSKDAQTPSLSLMYSDMAGFYAVPKGAGAGPADMWPPGFGPQLGRTFIWSDPNNEGGYGQRSQEGWGFGFKRYRKDEIDAWMIQGGHDVDEVVLMAECGYVFTNLTSA